MPLQYNHGEKKTRLSIHHIIFPKWEMFARGLCKFWICTLLTPLHWVCSCWALLMFYSCISYNWELNGSILNLHELKKGLFIDNLLFGFQTAWEFSLFRWKCDKTITFLLLIITAFAVKKNQGSFMAGDLRLTGKCYIHYNCNSVDATFRRCKPTVYFCKWLLQKRLLRKWFSVSCKCYRIKQRC